MTEFWDDANPQDPLHILDGPPWVRPVPEAQPRPCKCSHAESLHYRDRRDRPTCGISVCGCASFRPEENDQ